jgi:hypothetical protein
LFGKKEAGLKNIPLRKLTSMNTITTCLRRIAILPGLLIISTLALAQQDQETAMKAWEAYKTPGEMHAMLAKANGDWNTELTLWMDPAGQPVKSKGTCNNKMVLGNRYQQSTFTGDFLGQPMEGMGTLAYDNAKKQFESTWIDNMGSGIMKATGTYDPSTQTLTMKGVQTDPTTGKDIPFRETHRFVDDNTQVMEMYMTPEGMQEFKTMEIKFTRKM